MTQKKDLMEAIGKIPDDSILSVRYSRGFRDGPPKDGWKTRIPEKEYTITINVSGKKST